MIDKEGNGFMDRQSAEQMIVIQHQGQRGSEGFQIVEEQGNHGA